MFFVGTLFLGGGGIYLGLGILANGFWAQHVGDASNAPAWWVFGTLALVIVLVMNYLGVRLALRAMLTFAACSFIPMLFLAVVIIAKGGDSGNSLTVFNPGETSLLGVTGGGVLGGILIGILLFVGFEAAASIGEEANDPHNSIATSPGASPAVTRPSASTVARASLLDWNLACAVTSASRPSESRAVTRSCWPRAIVEPPLAGLDPDGDDPRVARRAEGGAGGDPVADRPVLLRPVPGADAPAVRHVARHLGQHRLRSGAPGKTRRPRDS